MNINKVKINGFSSFYDFKIKKISDRENIIIGTNGTGKTNFLNLVTTALSPNHQHLLHNMFKKQRGVYIEIYIKLSESNLLLFTKMFSLYIIIKLSFPNSHTYTSANLNKLIEMLSTMNLFNKPIKLERGALRL